LDPNTTIFLTTNVLIIGTHNIRSYEYQKFSWSIAQHNNKIISSGHVQYLQSRTCAPQKVCLIGLLQALSHTLAILKYQQKPANSVTLVICCQDKKTLTLIRHKTNDDGSSNTTSGEQDLLSEISVLLKTFKKYKTHHSTKNDIDTSTEKHVILHCVGKVQTCPNPILTTYKPTGPATVRMHNQEVSDNIENTLRQAAHLINMHTYLQTKYRWSDNTLANIDWTIHGSALQSFATRQRKTLTQLIHNWLPVNGHPGRANLPVNQGCPICKATRESQGHFLT
jgi:hypothetical protein